MRSYGEFARWEKGKGGSVKDCAFDAKERPPLEDFLGMQRRFNHLVQKAPANGGYVVRQGKETHMERLREWTQSNVERLYRLAELK